MQKTKILLLITIINSLLIAGAETAVANLAPNRWTPGWFSRTMKFISLVALMGVTYDIYSNHYANRNHLDGASTCVRTTYTCPTTHYHGTHLIRELVCTNREEPLWLYTPHDTE